MSVVPESDTGIWLNTAVKFIDIRSEPELQLAQNDSDWQFGNPRTDHQMAEANPSSSDRLESTSSSFNKSSSVRESNLHMHIHTHIHSHVVHPLIQPNMQQRLLPRLNLQRYRSPYSHVKYEVTTETLSNYNFIQQIVQPSFKLKVLDIGCSFQMLRCHLRKSIQHIEYTGVDSLPMIYPDILCDVSSQDSGYALKSATPNVVVALDVLTELHDTPTALLATLVRWLEAIDEPNGLYIFSIPECYESDEHLLKLTSDEWLDLLGELFIVEDIQAVGFLSALPYWVGKRLPSRQRNWLRKLMNVLKEPFYDSHVLKMVELSLTQALRRVNLFQRYSHTLIVSARPRSND